MPIRKSQVGVAVVATLLFLLLARWVATGDSLGFDLSVRERVHTWASPLTTNVLWAITMLGSERVMFPLGVILVGWLATTGRHRQAALLAFGSIGAELLSHLLKLTFHRARPAVFFDLIPAMTYSYPSGHALVATSFYGLLACVLASEYPHRHRPIGAALICLASVIGFTRVYLGYHYPSDVLAGWTCAVGWLALCGPPVYASGKAKKQRH